MESHFGSRTSSCVIPLNEILEPLWNQLWADVSTVWSVPVVSISVKVTIKGFSDRNLYRISVTTGRYSAFRCWSESTKLSVVFFLDEPSSWQNIWTMCGHFLANLFAMSEMKEMDWMNPFGPILLPPRDSTNQSYAVSGIRIVPNLDVVSCWVRIHFFVCILH